MKHTPTTKPQIEVVGVYPEKHEEDIIATFHFYLADRDIDIRGGKVFRRADGSVFVQVPQGKGTCDETGELIQFPIVSFTDKEYEKAVRREVTKLVTQVMLKEKMI